MAKRDRGIEHYGQSAAQSGFIFDIELFHVGTELPEVLGQKGTVEIQTYVRFFFTHGFYFENVICVSKQNARRYGQHTGVFHGIYRVSIVAIAV